MSTVRFVFPKPRLAELLKMPGGLPVAEALERAQRSLEEIKPTCIAELQALLELSEARFEAMGEAPDPETILELYAVVVRGIGGGQVCGAPAVDEVLTSLCDLLDALRTQGRFERDAIGVHLSAWRLLVGGTLPPEAAESILAGLGKVSARFAASPPPSSASE
ncbi:MAG: hypothetical protein ABI655_11330 [Phenylobacterium sp.]